MPCRPGASHPVSRIAGGADPSLHRQPRRSAEISAHTLKNFRTPRFVVSFLVRANEIRVSKNKPARNRCIGPRNAFGVTAMTDLRPEAFPDELARERAALLHLAKQRRQR